MIDIVDLTNDLVVDAMVVITVVAIVGGSAAAAILKWFRSRRNPRRK